LKILKNHSAVRTIAATFLVVHCVLLAWSAARHSPTLNEPAHLVAGLSHWEFGRFELYRVNPPLVRMIAALPVIAAGYEENWSGFHEAAGARPVAAMGKQFIATNGERSIWLFTLARWACIPFSLLGGYVCFRWASELYGFGAGLLSLALWCFSPNILAHGQLITPDSGATALGILSAYLFWRWLKGPSWGRAVAAGLSLGFAELTKTSLLLLFGVWPVIWLIYRISNRGTDGKHERPPASINQLILIVCLAVYVLNLGYGFEGFFQKLGDFQFVSETLTGSSDADADAEATGRRAGNRFEHSWLGRVPVPLPKNYVLGIDVQKKDFEDFGRPSYLRGEFRDHGWWYYYLYALAIKVPLGTWLLLIVAALAPLGDRSEKPAWRHELMLLAPALALLVFVSSQTGFSHHMRYVLPIFPFIFIWIGRLARPSEKLSPGWKWPIAGALAWSIVSSLIVYPHSLSYFNELAGGPRGGHAHLINSNIDWGQDLLHLGEWIEAHPEARPLYLAYYGHFDPADIGIDYGWPPKRSDFDGKKSGSEPPFKPGWYAVSVNYVRGYGWRAPEGAYAYLRAMEPAATAGYSIYIYRVTDEDIGSLRR